MMPLSTVLRYAWAAPNTALGLAGVGLALATGGGARRVRFRQRWTLEAHGGALGWLLRRAVPLSGGADALTLGHVVLGQTPAALVRCRAHEHVHIRQYERWGAFFLPAYFGASAWMAMRGRDAYRANPFEREAYGHEGCRGFVSRATSEKPPF